jgi:uncharacterized membrane protein
MKERGIKILWIAGTALAASAGFVVLGLMFGGAPLGWISISMSAILAVIVAIGSASLWVAWKKRQDAKAGYPAKDERTRLQEGRAAYYTIFISMYLMLALLWYNFLGVDLLNLPAFWTSDESGVSEVLIAFIIANAALFAGFRWYFLHGGKVRGRVLEWQDGRFLNDVQN